MRRPCAFLFLLFYIASGYAIPRNGPVCRWIRSSIHPSRRIRLRSTKLLNTLSMGIHPGLVAVSTSGVHLLPHVFDRLSIPKPLQL